jgi:endosialidase-like protein
MANQIANYYDQIDTPNPADMELQLQQLVLQGVISPEDAQAALAGPSAMNGITLDPKTKQAQMQALEQLQGIGDNGGMNLTDQANLRNIQNETNTAARGQREAILQNANQRGLGGSGLELMNQMKNQQDSATRASSEGLGVAAQAQQRALDAIAQGGTLAGNIQNQDFNQQAQIAGAQDAISKFNAQNQQATNIANTAAHNNAQQTNLQAKQTVSNTNADLQNKQQQYNKQLAQTNYENELKKAAGKTGVATNNAQMGQAQDNADRQNTNQLIGTGLTAAAMFSDKNVKEDIKKFDASEFLDSIIPKKYKYKDPSMGEGERYGIVAQDLERSPAGDSIVKDTPRGKAVDTTEATGPILAALGDLHHRLKRMEGA